MSEAIQVIFWVGLATIVGLLIGSFLNVCIYRLPAKITIVKGHSFCPNCKHNLGFFDLFPVFSYLLLGRKCRYCHQPIAARYMKVELLTGVYFGLAAALWRPGQVAWPAWLPPVPGADFEASLILTAAAALTFSALLVWAMIIWDQSEVPVGLFVFAIVPIAIRLAMQPERLLTHLFALFLGLLIVLFLAFFKLMPESTARQRLQFGGGVGLICLMGGLAVAMPVLIVCLIELLLMAILTRRGGAAIEKQAALLWRSLPLQVLVIGSVCWLVF